MMTLSNFMVEYGHVILIVAHSIFWVMFGIGICLEIKNLRR